MSFSNLGLSEEILSLLKAAKYKNPYPIQEKAIPHIIAGKDVLGIAKTGSGKTAAYALPILEKISQQSKDKSRSISGLILVPTRELAEQVKDVFHEFNTCLANPVTIKAVYGGVSINPQMKGLFGTDILVATPGRLLDLYRSKALDFRKLEFCVFDEADKLMSLGFQEELNEIISQLPSKRQNLLFSATLSDKVEKITQLTLTNPVIVKIEIEEVDLENISLFAYSISEEKKGPLLRYLIKEQEMKQVLVFCASSYKADLVANKLRKNGIKASAIHGKKSQGARTEALRDFKSGIVPVLVATDLLARGIDIEDLPYVINYELPRSPKDFVHRIGRTGRAEKTGTAIALIAPEDEQHFKIIQKKMKKWAEVIDTTEFNL
jgi:ATP-dependent RNA helicase RhlE